MTHRNGQPKLVAFLGSVRTNSSTGRVLAIAVDEAERRGATIEVIAPADLHLPLPGQGGSDDTEAIQRSARAADGVILATPEYHGSYSSVMKLVIDNLGFPSTLAGKPIATLGVAAGRIGAIKALEHLRSVASHVGGLVLPGPVSVAGVRGAFDEDGRLKDERTEQLVRGLTTGLLDFINRRCCPQGLEGEIRERSAAA